MRVRQSGNVKILVLVIALAVLAAGLLMLSDGFPPGVEDQATGTIVPAQRYHSSQITSDDVAVGSSVGGEVVSAESLMAVDADNASSASNASNQLRHSANDAVNMARVNDSNASSAGSASNASNASSASNQLRVSANDAVNMARVNDSNASSASNASNASSAANQARANDGHQ